MLTCRHSLKTWLVGLELARFFRHARLQGVDFAQALGDGEVAHFLRDLHGAELGAAHAAKVGAFAAFARQGFVVKFAGGVGVQAQVELVVPAEFKTGLAECIVAGAAKIGRASCRERV